MFTTLADLIRGGAFVEEGSGAREGGVGARTGHVYS